MLLPRSNILTKLTAVVVGALATADALAAPGETGASIRIASTPAGADLYIMGRHAGITPTVINERDIYPFSYDPANEALYGMVLLRKNGCEEYTRRLTRSDISDGFSAVLVCVDNTAAPARQPSAEPDVPPQVEASQLAAAVAVTTMSGETSKSQAETETHQQSMPEQRLQQLKVLQQLHDEGLISDQEEQSLRKRILDTL